MFSQEKDEKDSFWDIGKLIPKQKAKESSIVAGKTPTPVEIPIDNTSNSSPELTFSFENAKKEAPHSYAYQNLSSLIRNVEVIDWKNTYHYYEFFCKNALYFLDKRAIKCDRVSFFSYVPQYSQMSKAQLSWYLWWRENLHNGVYLDTDVSYILLYLYESINLGDRLDPQITLERMISAWAHYRSFYSQLDSSVAEWICDYSLIHRVPISFPHEKISREMISRSTLREVYYTFDPHDFNLYAKFLLTYCNAYNYRKSKFYNEETASLFDTHITGALAKLLNEKREFFLDGHCHLHKTSRTAFTGALCSYRMRKRIEVEYISLSDTEELKEIITSIIKYCENKLRAHLSIRSRLGVKKIESEMIDVLNQYFSKNNIISRSYSNETETPEYEKLYEVQDNDFSLDKAMQIERSSWSITERLIDTFEEETVSFDTKTETFMQKSTEKEYGDSSPISHFKDEIKEYHDFFVAVLTHDFEKQKSFCNIHGLLADAVVDAINEKAVECFEDILLEETVSGYCIIEDYRSMFE